jgi:hypothetical protein
VPESEPTEPAEPESAETDPSATLDVAFAAQNEAKRAQVAALFGGGRAEPSDEQTTEGPPDFDGGVREPEPPEPPSHEAWLSALLRDHPPRGEGTGGEW